MPMTRKHTRESLVAQAREIAARHPDRHLSGALFRRESGISEQQYLRCFRSYNAFMRAAGLTPYTGNRRIDDDVLLAKLHAAWTRANGPVLRHQVRRLVGHPLRAYIKRWGRWRDILTALRTWTETNDPGFAHLAALRLAEDKAWGRVPLARPSRRYGPVIDYPGLRHAPVNEQGVVLLFGMVAERLGFVIEGVGTDFPDCDAKRRAGDGWEAVRIEFELTSYNFRAHRHDENGCDVVVCWEHDWPDCPLPVLELKCEIERLRLGHSPVHESPASPPHPLARSSPALRGGAAQDLRPSPPRSEERIERMRTQ